MNGLEELAALRFVWLSLVWWGCPGALWAACTAQDCWLCGFPCNCHTCWFLMHISCKICRQVLWGTKRPQNRSREVKCCQGRGQSPSSFPLPCIEGKCTLFYILWKLKFSPRQTVQHYPCGVLPPEAVTEDKSAGYEGENTGSAILCPWGMTNIFCWGGRGRGQRLPESPCFLW